MNGETRQRVAKAIVAEEILSLAKELIAIPSDPSVALREKEVAAAIDRFFRREGIASRLEEVEEGRPNVYAELGAGEGPTLLWCGHTDTVRGDPFEGDPFAPRQEGDLLLGRGAVDMKASLACAMVALAGLKRAEIELAGKLLFAGVIDEEDRSAGCRALLRKQWPLNGAIVGEPTGLRPCLGHRGLEWLEIAFQGRAVHGGRAEEGINAIGLAGRFLHRVETDLLPRLTHRRHPLLGCSTLNWGWIQGGTQPSTVAGSCRLQLDRRWIPQERYPDVLAELQSVLDSLHDEDPSFCARLQVMEASRMEEGLIHPAFCTDPGSRLAQITADCLSYGVGRTVDFAAFPAWSDGGLLATYGGIPTLILGPGELTSGHSPREAVPISQMLPAALAYAEIAACFCNLA